MAHSTDKFENDVSEKPIPSRSTSTYTESKDDSFNATEVYTDEPSYVEMIDICHILTYHGRNRLANGKQSISRKFLCHAKFIFTRRIVRHRRLLNAHDMRSYLQNKTDRRNDHYTRIM